MDSRNFLSEQTFVGGHAVPGWRQLLLSVAGHCLVFLTLAGLLVLQRSVLVPVVVSPQRAQLAKSIPVGTVSLPPRLQRAPLQIPMKNARQRSLKARAPQAESNTEGTELQALRARAAAETRGIVQDFKFRGVYGFSLLNYALPFQISGQLPVITPDQLPLHYEQYVIVEITVNSEGRVADARVVAGQVDTKIQQTLLAAIREFKYRPATREGIPVPSQCDIVIHVPT
jgi:TonB family protein